MRRLLFVVVIMATLLMASCAPAEVPAAAALVEEAASSVITVAGSTTVQPLAELFSEAFMAENTGITVDVQGGGSSVGVKAAGEATSDIGMASREIKDSELADFPSLVIFTIARDGIAVVVNADVTVDDLSLEDVQAIFAGTITNWNEVGGADEAIIVVSREEGSGTRAAFEEMVMSEEALISENAILQPSNGAVRTTVSTTPASIGYLSFGYIDDTTKPVKIAGIAPTEENATNGSYAVVRPLNMLTNGKPTGSVKAFMDFIMSADGQAIVAEEGYLPVGPAGMEEAAVEEAIPALSGSITVAGSTTVQPLAELFSEAFSAVNTDVVIDIQGGGSSVGVKAAGEGTSDIGMASREIKESELTEFPTLVIFTIARDGIAVVVNADVAVDNLTIEQVQQIFAGEISNWSDVGGADEPIIVVSREEGSGTRAAFEEMVMGSDLLITENAILQPSNGAVRTTVSTTPASVGYLSFGYLDNDTKPVMIGGVVPNEENAANGSYAVVRPLNMMTSGEPTGIVKAFLDFIMSADGQAIVADEGYLPVK